MIITKRTFIGAAAAAMLAALPISASAQDWAQA